MKIFRNYMMIIACLSIVACNKVEIETPVFDVALDSLTFKVGDEVNFKFNGEPDQITFYSGEVLNDYAFKDGRIEELLGVNASFATAIRYGLAAGQIDMLSVWLSSDFNGSYTIEDVHNATWKNDVTQGFTLAPKTMDSSSAADYVPSDTLNLAAGAEVGKPLYFAFRYKKDAGGKQRNWFMKDISINVLTGMGQHTLFDGTAFQLVYSNDFTTTADKNSAISSGGIITMRSPNGMDPVPAEVWAISPAIVFGDSDLGPDKGVPIKGYRNPKVAEYTHTYSKAGTYTATFVASNSNIYGESKVVKQVNITVTQ